MAKILLLCFNCLLAIVIIINESNGQNPLFPNSVVSNEIDFIRDADPDSFTDLVFIGRDDKEMPSSLSNELFDTNTFIFEATFTDDETIEIWCHSSFLTQASAQGYAEKLCPRLGKLPVFQRNMLDHIVIHNGNAGAFAEIEGQFFVLYSDNMDDRISTNDLEETVFHESVHASYQFMYQNDLSWLNAQNSDATFVTGYGQSNPELEDMAESALFAYTLITYPGRLSEEIENWLETNIPNRLEWFGMLYTVITGIDEESTNSKIPIFPNPTFGICNITLEDIKPEDVIKVYDIRNGVLINSNYAKEGNNVIDLHKYPNGLYLIEIKGVGHSIIIKQ